VPNVVEIRGGWKLYIVEGGVMARILLDILAGDVMIITPSAKIHSFHPTEISTTLGTYLSRIMIDSLMKAR
jgi:hypothetical protein